MGGYFEKIAAILAAINNTGFIQEFFLRILIVVLVFVFLLQIVKAIKWLFKSRPVRFIGRLMFDFIRWLEMQSKFVARVVEFVKWFGNSIVRSAFNAFHTIEVDDGEVEVAKKIRANYLRGLVYDVADYWMAMLCALMVSQLNDWAWNFFWIFIATWAYDIICATTAIVGCIKSKQDLTLGEAHRRACEAVYKESKKAGLVYKLIQHPVAIIWDGPEQLVFFYKKELNGFIKITIATIGLTLIQSLFWAWIYSLGHETVSGLVRSLF